MLSIDFVPPLAQSLRLSVPSEHQTAVLNFTAALTATDYEHLRVCGAKLQLWSDIPIIGLTTPLGEWAECNFQDHNRNGDASDTDNPLGVIGHVTSQWEYLMSLQLSISLTGDLPHFEFTYRILYPNGDIRWLGQFGQAGNGILFFERSNADSLILSEGWSAIDSGNVWTMSTPEQPADNLEVLRLASPSDHITWAFGRENFYDTKDSSIAFIIPCVQPRSVFLPPIYVLHSSPEASFSLSPGGVVTFSGVGSIVLQASSMSHSDLLKHFDHHSTNHTHIITYPDAQHVLITTPKGVCPAKAAIIPITPRQICTRVRVTLDTLASLLPEAVDQFSIFSPFDMNIRFFAAPTREQTNEEILFTVGPTGGKFILSPVFNLKTEAWKVSVLSDYATAQLRLEPDHGTLPTPPPSPYLRPVAHLSPSPAPSDTSHHSVPFPSDVSIPQSPSGEASTNVDTVLTVHPQVPKSSIVSVCSRLVLSMASFILVSIFRFLFGYFREVHPAGGRELPTRELLSREIENDEAEAGATLTASSSTKSVAPTEQSSTDARAPGRFDGLDPVPAETHQRGSGQSITLPSLIVELKQGIGLIASQFDIFEYDIVFDMDGQIAETKVTSINDGISLWEFDGGQGGLLRMNIRT